MGNNNAIADVLASELGSSIYETCEFRGQLSAVVATERIVDICTFCRDEPRLGFDMLSDLTAVDYLPRVPRFVVVYNLYSFEHNWRLRLKARAEEGEPVQSVEGVWRAANWLEREVYDMFGIIFEGHSNLSRILLWDGYEGHPLRKDFPLQGTHQEVVPR